MTIETLRRLPKVRSLSQILPSGTEGGKEFARIIDLLMAHEARSRGENLTLFDDASGDFASLDSFSNQQTGGQRVGYQYKFFSSPLSNQHRSAIKKTIDQAVQTSDESKISKWVIVTPDDFTNSGRRKDGGDVAWFAKLQQSYPDIQIEHYGHSKIISLFLQAPFLCLYYYPELISHGIRQKSTLESLRRTYDAALHEHSAGSSLLGCLYIRKKRPRAFPLRKSTFHSPWWERTKKIPTTTSPGKIRLLS